MIAPTQQTTLSLAQAPTPQVDLERLRTIKGAWDAYRGAFPPPLKVAAGQPDDNVIANHMEPIVTKGVSFLFNQVLKIEATKESAQPDTVKQATIDGVWGDDDVKMTTLSKLGINGGVCGQGFVKIIPVQGKMRFPRLVVLDPSIIRIVTPPDDCELILAFIIEFPIADGWYKRQVIARVDPDHMATVAGEYDLDDTWTVTNYTRYGTMGNWAQTDSTDWPYPFAPIFTCQNLPNPNESWGMQDLTQDLINENKALNFLLSNLLRIVKHHGHPVTWASGLAAAQIQTAVDDLICLPSPDSKMGKLDPMTQFNGILDIAATIMSNIDEQSRVPAVALGRMTTLPRGNMSGVALQLLFQPLIEKTTQKQRLYGRLIREVSRAALVLAKQITLEEWEDYPIDLHWQSLLPSDDLQAAQVAVLLDQLGASMETIFSGLGMNAEDEMTKAAAEAKLKLKLFPPPPAPTVPAPLPGQAPATPGQVPPVSPFIGGGGQP